MENRVDNVFDIGGCSAASVNELADVFLVTDEVYPDMIAI